MIQSINTLAITGITFERLLKFFPYNSQQKPYRLKSIQKGRVIYSPFQNDDNIYLIKKGRVKVSRRDPLNKEHIQHIAWKGELFGELSLIQNYTQSEFAQALDATEYYEISKTAFQELMRHNWMVYTQILSVISMRFQALQKRLAAQLSEDTHTRIIRFLLDLAHERGETVGKYGFIVQPFLQQADIAALVGCSLPAVGMVLRKLKQKGLILYGKKRLQIYNRHELKHTIITQQ